MEEKKDYQYYKSRFDYEINKKKKKFKEKCAKTLIFVKENYDVLIIVIPAATAITGGLLKLGQKIFRNIAITRDKRIKDTRIYDRSLGKYLELKRPLNNNDFKQILARKENGEKLSYILMDLKLIK